MTDLMQQLKEKYDRDCVDLFIAIAKNMGMSNEEIVAGGDYLFEKHAQCRKKQRPCAGFSYGFTISMTPVNLGTGFQVRCTACNCEKDVTDYGSW